MIPLFVLLILLTPLGISIWGVAAMRRRAGELAMRIGLLEVERKWGPTPDEFRLLLERVRELEGRAAREVRNVPVAPNPVVEEVAIPVIVAMPVATAFIPEPVVVPVPEPIVVAAPISLPAPVVAEPGLGDRIRGWLGNDEWEALVGGSLLNKIGAVVLVIGIALFLGYSFGHVGPMGRATGSIVLSLALLATGVRLETQPKFTVFSRGLIGAGWAAMYATAYAIYAVPATRIVENPFVGSLVLLGVACGMIAHSLRYRVQAITGITYFAAFAALAITPETPFAVLSLVPMAASILYLAYRFDWYGMAVFGTAATYLTCMSKADAHAELLESQALLLTYWVLFEAFDWLRMRRRVAAGGVEWIGPLNALGFLAMSYGAWAAHAPGELWLAASYGAALYLGSAVVRYVVRRPDSIDGGLVERLNAGSFEGATLIAAVLEGMSIFGQVQGVWSSFAFAMETEVIYLVGAGLGSAFLRGLGCGGFGVSLLRLGLAADATQGTEVWGHVFRNWSPVALLHGGLFYVNREIRRMGATWMGAVFTSVAAGLMALVAAAEFSHNWAGVAWAAFGFVLLQTGLYRRAIEFRMQGYALMAGGFCWAAAQQWEPVAVCLGLACGVVVSLKWGETGVREKRLASLGSEGAVVVLAALLLWLVVPVEYLGIAWCLLSVAVLEVFRRYFPAMVAVAAMGVLTTHLSDLVHWPQFAVWATYVVAFGCSTWSAVRLSSRGNASAIDELIRDVMGLVAMAAATVSVWLLVPLPMVSLVWLAVALGLVELTRRFSLAAMVWVALGEVTLAYGRVLFVDLGDASTRLYTIPVFIGGLYWLKARLSSMERVETATLVGWCALGTFLALTWVAAGSRDVAVWWAAGALALLIYGVRSGERSFRLQGYALASTALAAAMLFDLLPVRLEVSLPVVAMLYVARFVVREVEDQRPATGFSLVATALMGAVLYNAVSGSVLTVAWGLEGLVLLSAGFALRDRIFRLQGLGLVLGCTLKLFLRDLRNLETPFRILSFIVLGLILLGVSWIYSRFREQVRRIL